MCRWSRDGNNRASSTNTRGWSEIRLCISNWAMVRPLWVRERRLYSMRSLILSQCRNLRIGVTWQNLKALTTALARQSSALYPEFLQHLLLSSSFNCFIVQSEYLLAISTANYTDIMVTQPSTCLRLSDNTAGVITWWRRLPEKFCRNPIAKITLIMLN